MVSVGLVAFAWTANLAAHTEPHARPYNHPILYALLAAVGLACSGVVWVDNKKRPALFVALAIIALIALCARLTAGYPPASG